MKQSVILEQHMSCANVDKSRSASFETAFSISDNDTLDDEVLEVIRKAKEEAILDKKFGLTIKEYGDCSDGNNRAKRGGSTESDRDSSNVSSSDDSDY